MAYLNIYIYVYIYLIKQDVLNMNRFTLGFMPREKYQILKHSDKNPCLLLNKSMQSQVN